MGARVIVLGIDAVNPTLVEHWSADGSLPNIRVLMGRGLRGATRSIDGFFVGSTWPSFQTGVTPARHGLHYLAQLKPGTYEYYSPARGEFIQSAPFWQRLSHAGRRVAVLDVPLTRLDPMSERMQVVEWGSHDAVFGFRATPDGLAADILSRFGPHPLATSCDSIERTPRGYATFIDGLVRGVQTKAALTRHYLKGGDWDFFIQVFTEAHCAGHQCWHLHDAAHPAHDPAIAETIGNPLRRVYVAIDEAIGEIIADAGDALVFVLAAHGMSYSLGAHFLLHDMLFRLGVSTPPAEAAKRNRLRAAVSGGARRVWRRLPGPVRARLSPLRARMKRPVIGPPRLRVDPAASLCFPVHNGLSVGGIRLNLIGREPHGLLEPSDAGPFGDDLSGELLSIVDDATGEPIVRRVLRTAEMFSGDHIDALPDLLVEWSDTRRLGNTMLASGAGATMRIRSPRTGIIEGVNDYGRTGEHRAEGMFIAAGPGVAPGRLDQATSIMDFAPTFAALLGVELPPCDGTPIAAFSGVVVPVPRRG